MLNRHLRAFGIVPWVGYVLGLVAFVGGVSLLYFKSEHAGYILSVFGLMTCYKLSETARNDFLKTCFDSQNYRKVRLFENGLVGLPFVLTLLAHGDWWIAIATLVLALLLSLLNLNTVSLPSIPTPFGRYPFEMAVGFRKAIIGFIIIITLTIIAISVGNFNLGAFAFGLVGVLCAGFYANAELPYFVWIFSARPATFLFQKIATGLVSTVLLGLPVALALAWYFPDIAWALLIIQGVVVLLVVIVILAKYSVFPKAISLPESLLMGFSFLLPPLLLFSIPYFYKKSIRQLSKILA